ncbi:MAG TPA: LPS assembly lipoprotein LptE [Myxococcota bacterium]|nr:LPS assembly lipoprotein LptE [Myxococcota bacterium]
MLRLLLVLLAALVAAPARAAPGTTVLVAPFDNKTAASADASRRLLGDQLAESIATLLAGRGGFSVVERERLDAALAELGLATSGLADNSAGALRLGALALADLVITGSLQEQDCAERSYRGYGVTSTTWDCRVTAAVRVFEVNTGRVQFGDILTVTKQFQQTQAGGSSDTGMWRALVLELARVVVDRVVTARAAEAPPPPPPAYVRVEVVAKPAGASVILDGIMMGSAPTALEATRGVHVISVEMPGWFPWEQRVMITDGARFELELEKKPAPVSP